MENIDNSKEEQLWEQRRYETAKEFMSVVMGRANYDPIIALIMSCSCSGEEINPYSHIAVLSVQAADALIEVLKGKEKEVRDIQKSCYFRKGEPVLVRDYGGDWKIKAFTKMQDGYCKYGATTDGLDECGYRQCIPYNERTMHLLGTTEDYKEE